MDVVTPRSTLWRDALLEESSHRRKKDTYIESRLYDAIYDFASKYGFSFEEAVEVIYDVTKGN